MTGPFDTFIVFAEMRTGSNLLEANLNALDGVACYGEAFNPHFIGYPNATEILGVNQEQRDANPDLLLETIKSYSDGIGGFRYFHDHDPRIFDTVIANPRCAKIILTRNPLDSYVSWKIAQSTGQWKLTNVKRRREARAHFDGAEFEAHVQALQAFQITLQNALQKSGQTAFYLTYEDVQSLDVINGLAAFLGVESRLVSTDQSLKPQNPARLEDKIVNPSELAAGLARLDRFNLAQTPNFEPRRGPAVPSYVAAAKAPLLYMPVRSGPEAQVCQWLAGLDGVQMNELQGQFNQKHLREWKKSHPGHRSFTVVRHPVQRLYAAFCDKILSTGPGSFIKIRNTLKNFHKLPIPGKEPGEDWTPEAHRAAFIAFAEFAKLNLSGQTSIRVDAHWCTQAQAISNISELAAPDMILREEELPVMLPVLAALAGAESAELAATPAKNRFFDLAEIYTPEVEDAVRDAYGRDYLTFGYSDWRPL